VFVGISTIMRINQRNVVVGDSFDCGALGGRFTSARVHAYGPLYGSGGAVIEFTP